MKKAKYDEEYEFILQNLSDCVRYELTKLKIPIPFSINQLTQDQRTGIQVIFDLQELVDKGFIKVVFDEKGVPGYVATEKGKAFAKHSPNL